MTESEFERRLSALGATGKTKRDKAAYSVLVTGQTCYEAAKAVKTHNGHVGKRCRQILDIVLCEHCGQSVQPHK